MEEEGEKEKEERGRGGGGGGGGEAGNNHAETRHGRSLERAPLNLLE